MFIKVIKRPCISHTPDLEAQNLKVSVELYYYKQHRRNNQSLETLT